MYEAYFPFALCEGNAMWVNLKVANNLPIQTLGVMQSYIEVWGGM